VQVRHALVLLRLSLVFGNEGLDEGARHGPKSHSLFFW
jgi:hypothetical protein